MDGGIPVPRRIEAVTLGPPASASTQRVTGGPMVFRVGRSFSRVQQVGMGMLVIAMTAALGSSLLWAQSALAQQWADARVQREQVRFLLEAARITADEARTRTAAIDAQVASIRLLVGRLPREGQADLTQESERLFQVAIVPLREQWNETLRQKRAAAQAADAARRADLATDA